jgi:hypothetical protein
MSQLSVLYPPNQTMLQEVSQKKTHDIHPTLMNSRKNNIWNCQSIYTYAYIPILVGGNGKQNETANQISDTKFHMKPIAPPSTPLRC